MMASKLTDDMRRTLQAVTRYELAGATPDADRTLANDLAGIANFVGVLAVLKQRGLMTNDGHLHLTAAGREALATLEEG